MTTRRNENFIETVTVPILLIVLGLLFLLDDRLGWSVGRAWPVLLMAWGALRILSSRTRPRAEDADA